MPHRTLIVLVIGVSLGASVFVAHHVGPYGTLHGFLILLCLGLVPVAVAQFQIASLIFTGGVLVFLFVLGVRAWRSRSTVRTVAFCSLLLATATIANVHTFLWNKNH